jgi:aspartate/methionine/tyrosine aminotransferase
LSDEARRLNDVLGRGAPAALRCLSPLGRRLAFPRGIPFQAAEARDARIDATIGQLTDGSGRPLPLPLLEASVRDIDLPSTFLYSPVDGPPLLRRLWGDRERRLAGDPKIASTLPVVTHGLTHGLSLVADLFADPDTAVLVPMPAWENYELLFELHAGARVVPYPFFGPSGGFNVEALADALSRVKTKAIVVLNFPSNPHGYAPTPAEVEAVVQVITSHPGPVVAVTDDAYQGWVYEDGLHPRSVFWDLAEQGDPERLLAVKVGGATKELVFFASRVGFLTFGGLEGEAEAALNSKVKTVIRGTVGMASGPAMAMSLRALQDPALDAAFAERRDLLARRYRTLKKGLDGLDSPKIRVRPFNSAYFALLELTNGLQAETLRRRLLADHSVGTIAFPVENALRLAYCSIHEDRLPELVAAIARAVD